MARAELMQCRQKESPYRGIAQKRHTGAGDSPLEKNAVVMFIKNSFDEGYVNGTLGVVEDLIIPACLPGKAGAPIVRTFSGQKILSLRRSGRWKKKEKFWREWSSCLSVWRGRSRCIKARDEFGCSGN